MKKLLIGLFLVCLAVSGCSSSKPWDQQLIGSWRMTENSDGKPAIVTYTADGTFIAKTPVMDFKGFWKVADAEKRHIKTWSTILLAAPEAEAKAEPTEVTIEGDAMVQRDVNGAITKFVRVPDDEKVSNTPIAMNTPPGAATPAAPVATPVPQPTPYQMTQAELDYVDHYAAVVERITTAESHIRNDQKLPAEQVVSLATSEIDAAWQLHLQNTTTPTRFMQANAYLGQSLVKYRATMRGFAMRDEDSSNYIEAGNLLKQSAEELKKQEELMKSGK